MTQRNSFRQFSHFFVSLVFLFIASKLSAKEVPVIPLSIPPTEINVAFQEFTSRWFDNEKDWNDFFIKHSRIIPAEAPAVAIDWKKFDVIALFWESKDAIIREPAYLRHEAFALTTETPPLFQIKFDFLLNTPCFGIFTDESPSMFFLISKEENAVLAEINTRTSQETGCWELGDEFNGDIQTQNENGETRKLNPKVLRPNFLKTVLLLLP